MQTEARSSDLHLAVAGMIALAVAMGIGRFAFTPVLPLMQSDMGLTLVQGGWLASANYLGYLVGAVAATRPGPGPATLLRAGLALVVATTAWMAFADAPLPWAAARFAAGVASAWVLVGTAVLSLGRLAESGRSQLSGIVFAGVGLGIAIAGLLCHVMGSAGWPSRTVWWTLALVAGFGAVFAGYGTLERRRVRPDGFASGSALTAGTHEPTPGATTVATGTPDRRAPTAGGSILVLCYGLFGFGYILPATFLPAQARALIADPAVFGWVWPVFGLAAMASTLVAARRGGVSSRRARWAAAQLVMAAGVILPVVWESLAALVLAALCVGGTFMVVTMLGMQEARAVAGANAQSLMAAMTAAFATGQLLGPLVAGVIGALGWPIDAALVLAAAGLVASTLLLGWSERSMVRAIHGSCTGGSKMNKIDPAIPQGFGHDRSERLPLPSHETMNDAQRTAADALINGPRKGVKGPFIPLLRSPDLLERVAKVGEYLRFEAVLPTRVNEFVTLVVARHTSNQFEWAVHYPLAIAAGTGAETLEDIAQGGCPRDMSSDESAAYDFAIELLNRHGVTDVTYERALLRWGEQGVVELSALIGYFACVCWVMNVARTPAPGATDVRPLCAFPG